MFLGHYYCEYEICTVVCTTNGRHIGSKVYLMRFESNINERTVIDDAIWCMGEPSEFCGFCGPHFLGKPLKYVYIVR